MQYRPYRLPLEDRGSGAPEISGTKSKRTRHRVIPVIRQRFQYLKHDARPSPSVMSRHAPTWSDKVGATTLADGAGPATCVPCVLAREAGSLPVVASPHEGRRRRPRWCQRAKLAERGKTAGGTVAWVPAAARRGGSLEFRHMGSSVLRPSGRTKRPSTASAWREPFPRPRPKPDEKGKQPTSPKEQAGVLGPPYAP